MFEKARDGCIVYRKSPRKRAAGEGYFDPSYQLPVEWLEARARIDAAEKRQKDPRSPSRILIVNGSTRSEHTCPGDISRTRRLAQCVQETIRKLQQAAMSLANMVQQIRSGTYRPPDPGLHSPREK